MKLYIVIALVGCLVVASLAQDQVNAAPVELLEGTHDVDHASLTDEDTTGVRNKRQFGYGGYGRRGFGGYGGGFRRGYGRRFGGFGGYGGYGR